MYLHVRVLVTCIRTLYLAFFKVYQAYVVLGCTSWIELACSKIPYYMQR